MENTNINIPVTTVDSFVETMTRLYAKAINAGVSLRMIPAPFLWGAPGVGKSDGVRQLADNLSEQTGKRVIVTDVRLLLFSPVDLRGVPVADQNREFTNWLRPRIFHMDDADDCVNILFLDELSAAPQSVQAAAYQICLDRRVGEHELPENCIVISAGNRTTDRSVSYKMPKALCNRLMHFGIEPSYTQWKRWALAHDIDERIIGFLSFDNSRLCVEPESSDLAYPTPRSWSFVSRVIQGEQDLKKVHMLIASCVGVDTALCFEEWCRVFRELPDTQDIIAGKCHQYPKNYDALYALIASLSSAVYRMKNELTESDVDHICTYAVRFPSDFAVSFFGDLNRDKTVRLKLMNCRLFGAWLHKNRSAIKAI